MKILYIVRPNLFTVPGGDTIQIQNTSKYLNKLGVNIEVKLANENINYTNYNLIHFFNIIRPSDILKHISKSKLPYVISTIFVDYSEYEENKSGIIRRILLKTLGSDALEFIKKIARVLLNGEPIISNNYVLFGHKKSIKKIIRGASILLPNSESEYLRLEKKYNISKNYIVVPNAIDNSLFTNNNQNNREGVICVARIEGLKNQLNLIKAIGNKYTLKIIGKSAPNHKSYLELCKQNAGENVEFINHVTQQELIDYYKKAKVHVLPSWFETTGLSSLEAAYMGCNIVVTDKGDQKEYFKDYAFYCDPDSVTSIQEAIDKAYNTPYNSNLKTIIDNNYIWEVAAEKTLNAYKTVLET